MFIKMSGEYAMLKIAAQNGWPSERVCVLEALWAFMCAGRTATDELRTQCDAMVTRSWLNLLSIPADK